MGGLIEVEVVLSTDGTADADAREAGGAGALLALPAEEHELGYTGLEDRTAARTPPLTEIDDVMEAVATPRVPFVDE